MLAIADIKDLVLAGTGVSIDAMHYAPADIKALAVLASRTGATVIVRNASLAIALADIKAIAVLAPGKVVFEV